MVGCFRRLSELSGRGVAASLGDADFARVLFVEDVELAAGTPENIAQHDGAIEPRLFDRFILRLLGRVLILEHSERIPRGALQGAFKISSNRGNRESDLFCRLRVGRGEGLFEFGELQFVPETSAQLLAETIS